MGAKGGKCKSPRKYKKVHNCDISSENVKGTKHFGDLGVNWRIILVLS